MSSIALVAAGYAQSKETNKHNDAKHKTCETLIANYDAQYATVEQMQSYAQCVQLVHPVELESKKQDAQVLINLCFICAVIGVVIMYRDIHSRNVFDLGFAAFLGVMAGIFMFCFGNLIFWAFS